VLSSIHIIEEALMPVETIIFVSGVVAAFGFFAIVVGNASRQTDKLLRERTRSS
jgi:hypothetical protein